MALAIFDLDNTLLRGDSDYLWGNYLIEKGAVEAEFHRRENDRFYQQYLDGEMDIMELKKEPHLSASSINDYIDCGLLHKFGRIDRVPPEFIADALEFGATIHRVLAEFYQERMTNMQTFFHKLDNLVAMILALEEFRLSAVQNLFGKSES